MSTETGATACEPGGPDPRVKRIELLVFCLFLAPSLVMSLFIGSIPNLGFPIFAVASILRDAGLVSLIAFFLWRNGEPLSLIGWTKRHAVREALLGGALFVPLWWVVVPWLMRWFYALGLTQTVGRLDFLKPHGGAEMVLAVVTLAVVAVSEETIFRGYLMLRLRELTRSSAAILLVATAMFAIPHGYQGTLGVASAGAIGALLGVVYLWRGSLVAPIVMHFLQDFTVIVALPFFAHH